MCIQRFMTLAQAYQILGRGEDLAPLCCDWSKKLGPDRVKKLAPNFFDKKSMYFIMKTYNFTWD